MYSKKDRWIPEIRKRRSKIKTGKPQKSGTWSPESFSNHNPEILPARTTCISEVFIPIVKCLRVIGFCPLKIKQDPVTKSTLYEFRWLSFYTLYSVVLSVPLCILAGSITGYLAWNGLTKDFQEVLKLQRISLQNGESTRNYSFVAEFGTRIFPITLPLFAVNLAVGTLNSIPGIVCFLNRWPKFQLQYMKAFPNRKDDPFVGLERYRNRTFLISPIYCIAAITSVVLAFQNCQSLSVCLFLSYNSLSTITACFTLLVLVGTNMLHSLIFYSLLEAFKQIRIGLKMWVKEGVKGRCIYKDVKQWTYVISLGKEQMSTIGKAISFYQALMVFIKFVYLCLGVFSSFIPSLGEAQRIRGYVLLVVCIWGFSFLIWKAIICDQIRNEEHLITKELSNLNAQNQVPALIQINNLIYMINENPAEIKFWNVVSLNKSFLLKLFGQVATYLIVLIQFDNVQRDRFL